MCMRLIFFALFLLVLGPASGQEKQRVENVMGQSELTDDITPVEAREKAIQNAKTEALRRAGATEYVSELNVSNKSEVTDGKFIELWNSLITSEVNGEVSSYKIRKEEKNINEKGTVDIKVWLDADVTIHESKSDPNFFFHVNDLRENYVNLEKLSFKLKPSMPGFVNVFILGEKESNLLYPNSIEKSENLDGENLYSFPRSKALDYEVSTDTNVEINYILILLTKKLTKYTGDNSINDILSFVSKINKEEKYVKVYPIVIKKPH
jgi:hypothetical protein